MAEDVATITSKGQVTIPAEVRRRLGLKPGDKITFEVNEQGDAVTVRPARYATIASLRGAAGTLSTPLAWDEMRRIAREDRLADSFRQFP